MNQRRKAYRRNEHLEDLLQELNYLLETAQKPVLAQYAQPRYPVILLVACARAGSTIMLQWLAGTGYFAYATNLLSRFYAAPYIGARIQQLLTDSRYRFRDELADFVPAFTYVSDLGKTRGVLAPNEFWYFWRRFFHFGEIQTLTPAELRKVKRSRLLSELAALESVFDKPILLKAHIINWIIPFVARMLKKALFIHITREPLYTAQSLLESRKKYFGTIHRWYSFKPPEYDALKTRNPYAQVAGQIWFTDRAITQGLASLDPHYWMRVSYEEFCAHPAHVFRSIQEKLSSQGFGAEWRYTGPRCFECRNRLRLTSHQRDAILRAYTEYAHSGDSG